MKYMLLIYGNVEAHKNASAEDYGKMHDEYVTYTEELAAAGELVSGEPLEGNDAATTVRIKSDETVVSDGPFIETSEVLGGYYVIDVPDLDKAIAWAARLPGARRELDTIEIRPVMAFP